MQSFPTRGHDRKMACRARDLERTLEQRKVRPSLVPCALHERDAGFQMDVLRIADTAPANAHGDIDLIWNGNRTLIELTSTSHPKMSRERRLYLLEQRIA